MPHNEREPHALGTRRPSESVIAGQRDDPSIATLPDNFQRLGDIVALVLAQTARRVAAADPACMAMVAVVLAGGRR